MTFRSFPLSSHFSGFVLPLEALLELLLVRDLDLLLREDALLELLDRFPFFFFFLDFLSFFRDFFDFFDLSFFFSDREVKASCCNWATAASKAFNSALLGAAFPPPGNPSAATPARQPLGFHLPVPRRHPREARPVVPPPWPPMPRPCRPY